MTVSPLISVVTPSLNQDSFIRETLESVISQSYPHWELIVIDGGSTDDSVAIIQSFAERLAYWVSEPDCGQAHAINKGFSMARGEVLCYLNSDDILLPDALAQVAAAAQSSGDWWTGGCLHFGVGQTDVVKMPRGHYSLARLAKYSPLAQPATFWSRSAFEKVGALNQQMHYAFDFEYWLRMALAGFTPVAIPRVLAGFRHHDKAKTCMAEYFYAEERVMFPRLQSGSSLQQKAILLRACRWRSMMANLKRGISRSSLLMRYPEVLFSRGGIRYLAGIGRRSG